MTNDPATVPAGAPRKWRGAVFFVVWTVLAGGVVWWLLHSEPVTNANAQLVFDGSKSEPLPIGEQIARWLKLADLNFRGAYPWILLAPYVIWLALRFHIERGRLRFSVPVHLTACILFAMAAAALSNRSSGKTTSTVIVSTHSQGGAIPWNLLTNRPPPFGPSGPVEGRVNFQSSTSYVTGAGTRVSSSQSGFASSFTSSSSGSASFGNVRVNSARLFPHLLDILAYASLVGIAQAVHFQRRYRERERRAMLLESHLAKARLHALQAQLQPHFLFNALNAVATLLRRDPRLAQDALMSFSELLRLALSQSDKQEISLRDDLLFLERYVDIQKIRLGERLRFETDIQPGLLDCLVPSLLLQPLVENALRHGIEPSPNPGIVRVIVQRQGNRLALRIEDNGIGLVEAKKITGSTGIGLSNLRARLETIYGRDYRLDIAEAPTGGVIVNLEIPIRRLQVTDDRGWPIMS